MQIERLPTNSPLDKLLNGGIEHGVVTNVYGPAGSGKTNISLCTCLSCINNNKKIIYIDTEGSFSLERFSQLGGNEDQLKNIIIFEPHAWNEQHENVHGLEKIMNKEDIGLIIVDSLVALYRLELDNENFQQINKQLATQYSILSKIARTKKIPVLVTNQVYSDADGGVELTSRMIGRYWAKALIELKKTGRENHRVAVIKKHRSVPEGRKIEFEILKDGLKHVGKFNLF